MRKAIATAAIACLAIAVLLGLGILVPRPFSSEDAHAPFRQTFSTTTRTVLILSSRIHTDIAFPADADVIGRFRFMARDGLDPGMPGVAHVIAGWGGRSFYIETPTWADLKPGPVFKALTLDRSVMHMALAGPIDRRHPDVITLNLPPAAFDRLLAAVSDSFMRGANRAELPLAGAQYGPYDRFYEARGSFNALVGCNVWTARMLRAAGITTGWWTPLPGLLTAGLALHNDKELFVQVPGAR
ncbi:TIGR02117 family protein [Hoeflea olei]|uniref:Urease-associated protein n=1 Tax=Hoeflea olei TaxID=1480615 RepID=A0A1C1YZC6_9HYPH|nr:TIGR02117 family protein [Hoeflea olei]OCW58827.1 hypothetical protein AWJ14_20795 [Hoeflea olei]